MCVCVGGGRGDQAGRSFCLCLLVTGVSPHPAVQCLFWQEGPFTCPSTVISGAVPALLF